MRPCAQHSAAILSVSEKGRGEMRGKLATIGLVLMLSAVILTGFTVTPIHAASTSAYIVQPGDTLIDIAARHGVSVSELAGANGLRWDSWVYAGQRLAIPDSQPDTDVTYVVRSGDTLISIASHFGTTTRNIVSTNQLLSTRIYVGQRLTIPCVTSKTVDNWTGRIINLPSGSQHTHYFERSDGQQFGIGSPDDALGSRIAELRWSGQQFRVWGSLRTDVPSYAGQYIAVERLEIVSDPGTETRNLTPLATASASSHLHTDRWGQYQPWMAMDGSPKSAWVEGVAGPGVGQWIILSFPGTVEVHSVNLDVGYDKNADIFAKNNRISRATLIFSNGERLGLSFADKRGLQTMPLVRAPCPSIQTTSVKVVIEEVFPGWKYDDTCLAEIEVWGRTY
jgi:LysM repeat protein